jgi:hypothetical protein
MPVAVLIHGRKKEKVQKDKQRPTKHTHKTKDRVTRTPLQGIGILAVFLRFLIGSLLE